MKDIENFVLSFFRRISLQQKIAFICVIVAGFISHGYIFTNNIAYHDAIMKTHSFGAGFMSGRWALELLKILCRKTVGLYASPLFNGALSLFFIALSGMLIVSILRIQYKLSSAYIGIMLAVFPVVTSIFAFMYASGIYWLSLFLNVLAVYILTKKWGIKRYCVSSILLAVALGIYQAYLAVSVSLFILSLMVDILENISIESKQVIRRGVSYLVALCSGLVLYLLLNKIITTGVGVELTSYQGINEMGKLDLKKIPSLIKSAYFNCLFDIEWNGINNTFFVRVIIIGVLIGSLLLVLKHILFRSNMQVMNKVLFMALLTIFPLAIDMVYMMSANDNYFVHTLMRYSLVLFFVLSITLLDHTVLSQFKYSFTVQLARGG